MMLTHLDIAARLKLFSKLACWIAIFSGVLVLLGWLLGNTTLTMMLPSLVSMTPNAALALILSGTALRVLQDDVRWPRARLIAWECAAATATIGLLMSVEYVIDWNGGLDEWLFETSPGDLGRPMSGRMGLNTAVCFLSIGLALLVLDNHLLGPYVTQTLTLVAMGNACAALLGYAYRIESLYGIASSTPLALHSSIVLIAMGVGILCARPKQGWMALLISDRIGSQVARRLLPAAILVPFVNGLLEVHGKRLGFYDEPFGAALVTTSGIIVFGVLIWWTATSLNRVDQQRRVAEHKRDLYQNMFIHSKDGIVVMDPRGYYLEQNPQHERLLGYVSGELIGQTPALVLGESDFARIAEDLTRTGMYRGEALCRTKSGKDIPFDLSSFSVKDEQGHVVCHVCIKRDMTDRMRSEQILREAHDELEQRVLERTSALMKTNEALQTEVAERKRAEEALRESEKRFRAIFNQASVGIAEVRPDGHFLRVNAKLCEILGRPAEALLAMTFQELTHPDDLPGNLAVLRQALAGEQQSYSFEKRYVRPEGTAVWCRLSVSVLRTLARTPTHCISVVEDISESKRTTDALRTIAAATASVTEEDFFRSLVSHLAETWPVRYAFVGELMDGKPQRVRTLAMWAGSDYGDSIVYGIEGTPCEQVIQQRVTCFYPHGVQRRFPTDAFLVDMGVESYYGVPLLDRGGHMLGLLAVMHDQPLSLLPGMEQMLLIFSARAGMELERKRTLEALRFSDQALRQLIDEREQLAQDLHDGIIQSIYAAGLGLEEGRRLVQEGSPAAVGQIQTVVDDLNSLIDDVRNHIIRKPREIKNGQQLKLALERLTRVLRTCPAIEIVAAIERSAADRLRSGEATHIYYIAAEALSNAVRHSHARQCSLGLRMVQAAVRLEVSDNGCGFDPSVAHQGHGLRNLSGRAAKLGTQLQIVSFPGGGTRIMVDLLKEPGDDGTER